MNFLTRTDHYARKRREPYVFGAVFLFLIAIGMGGAFGLGLSFQLEPASAAAVSPSLPKLPPADETYNLTMWFAHPPWHWEGMNWDHWVGLHVPPGYPEIYEAERSTNSVMRDDKGTPDPEDDEVLPLTHKRGDRVIVWPTGYECQWY